MQDCSPSSALAMELLQCCTEPLRLSLPVAIARALILGIFILVNSSTPGSFWWNWREVIFKLILVIYGWGICCEIALRWLSLHFTDGKVTLVQVMAWCHQATSHYECQCWPNSMLPNEVTKPQWVKSLQLIWRSGNCRWNQQVPDLQMSYHDLT